MKRVGLVVAMAIAVAPMATAHAALLVNDALPTDWAIPPPVNSNRVCVVENAPSAPQAKKRGKARRARRGASGRLSHAKGATRAKRARRRPVAPRAIPAVAPAGRQIACDELVEDHFAISPIANDLANAMMAGQEMDQIGEQKLMHLKRRRGQRGRSFAPVVSAAPEAATWLLMIVGFGLVGAAMRSARRRQLVSHG